MLEFIETALVTTAAIVAMIGVIILSFVITRKDNTEKAPKAQGEVLFQSRTTVLRRGNKIRVIREYTDRDDRWEI